MQKRVWMFFFIICTHKTIISSLPLPVLCCQFVWFNLKLSSADWLFSCGCVLAVFSEFADGVRTIGFVKVSCTLLTEPYCSVIFDLSNLTNNDRTAHASECPLTVFYCFFSSHTVTHFHYNFLCLTERTFHL